MANPTLEVLTEQVDELAGTVARLELQVNTLIKMLSKRSVSERCGLPSEDLLDLKYPNQAIPAKGNHRDARRERVHAAEREQAITALIDADIRRKRYKELTGEEMPEE